MQFYISLRRSLACLLLMLFSQVGQAEGILMQSVPRDNEMVANFDGKVKFGFSGNVSERSPTLVVLDSEGNRVDNNDLSLVIADRSLLSATTKPLKPGKYVVRYRVVTEDGLIVSGISHFGVKP